jgi:RNA 2',3'-cyclic 3'-phosphodiesterase
MGPVRLFVAVWPPEDVLDLVAALERPSVEGIRWTTRAQWHVTLRFLGEMADPDPVVESLNKISGSPTAVARLGPHSAWFPGYRVLQTPVDGLRDLEASVSGALSELQSDKDRRSGGTGEFHGHLTLARVRGARRIGRDDRSAVSGAEISSTWTVGSVSLVASVLGRDGSRYTEIANIALRHD